MSKTYITRTLILRRNHTESALDEVEKERFYHLLHCRAESPKKMNLKLSVNLDLMSIKYERY